MSYLRDSVYRSVEQVLAPGAIADGVADAWRKWKGVEPDDVAVGNASTMYDPFEGATLTAEACVVPRAGGSDAVRFCLVLQVFATQRELGLATERAASGALVATEGPPFFTLPTLRTAVWTLPNGPGPRALRWAMGSDNLSRLAKLDAASAASPPFERRMRCVARSPRECMELHWQGDRATDYVLKLLSPANAAATESNYRVVDAARTTGSLPVRLPELVAFDRERQLLLLRQPRGRPFESVLREPFREPFEKVGEAVAGFHRSDVRPSTRRSAHGVLEAVEEVAEVIVRTLPELQSCIGATMHRLREECPDGAGVLERPTHGDLDGEAILDDGDGLAIVGWDLMARAHPYLDLASVTAHAIDIAIENGLPTSVTRACVRAMMTTYSDGVGAPIQRTVFAWHLAAALLVRAGRGSLRRLQNRWCPRVIGLAEEALRTMSGESRYVRTR